MHKQPEYSLQCSLLFRYARYSSRFLCWLLACFYCGCADGSGSCHSRNLWLCGHGKLDWKFSCHLICHIRRYRCPQIHFCKKQTHPRLSDGALCQIVGRSLNRYCKSKKTRTAWAVRVFWCCRAGVIIRREGDRSRTMRMRKICMFLRKKIPPKIFVSDIMKIGKL